MEPHSFSSFTCLQFSSQKYDYIGLLVLLLLVVTVTQFLDLLYLHDKIKPTKHTLKFRLMFNFDSSVTLFILLTNSFKLPLCYNKVGHENNL